jgi:hypothetical protein
MTIEGDRVLPLSRRRVIDVRRILAGPFQQATGAHRQ